MPLNRGTNRTTLSGIKSRSVGFINSMTGWLRSYCYKCFIMGRFMGYRVRNVCVIGAGTMGTQIAVHALCFGYKVTIFDVDSSKLEKSLQKVRFAGSSSRAPIISPERWMNAAKSLKISLSLKEALKDADLVMEAGPEDIAVKRDLFKQMDELTSDYSILATTSSSIPVSRLLPCTEKDKQCLNLHFYPPTIVTNMVDVMGSPATRAEVMDVAVQWVISLGCVPLNVKKELLGFCYNRIWRAIKKEVLFMWAEDFVDYREIDRAWMIANGTPMGPFGLMDAIGLDVVYDIEMIYYQDSNKPEDFPPSRLEQKIKQGELGAKTRHGFYTYPNPEYNNPDF
ncbi:MAG: 3-hydroxyacyl-CoA dehydrogenase family protein, partial [Firmicutes bacterium]|nr:3-hydroxyacyl-CoA dehydrogenase family protein [Bacillota bacterium]